LDGVLDVLCSVAKVAHRVGDEPDAETRRNALFALNEIVDTLGEKGDGSMSPAQAEKVFSAYCEAAKDYSVDKRGDVGSWCRLAAMDGLFRLLSNGTRFQDSALLERWTQRACQLYLKQLSEKLDNVRAFAGEKLEALLGHAPPLPVPRREALVDALLSGNVHVNWSLAKDTFPKVVSLLDMPEYHDAVLAGLVLSVGGLTESVVKSSSGALLDWARELKSAGAGGKLRALLCSLGQLFDTFRQHDRVIIPLMKTVLLLFANDVFESFVDWPGSNNPVASLFERIQAEMLATSNVPKLFTAVEILISLLQWPAPLRENALALVVAHLGHRFPRVRKHTAEQLYHKILVDGDVICGGEETQSQFEDTLSSTVWDGDIDIAVTERDILAQAASLQLPKIKSSRKQTSRAGAVDELDSYQHLVNDAGY